MASPASDRVARVRPYSGAAPQSHHRRLRGSHPLWPPVPGTFGWPWDCSLRDRRGSAVGAVLQPPARIGLPPTERTGFGLFPGRSPLLGECSLFLGVLRCFSSPTCLVRTYVFGPASSSMTWRGLPHSGTRGSARSTAPRGVSSPCHALHRLPSPRHPPRALPQLGPRSGPRCFCALVYVVGSLIELIRHMHACLTPSHIRRPASAGQRCTDADQHACTLALLASSHSLFGCQCAGSARRRPEPGRGP